MKQVQGPWKVQEFLIIGKNATHREKECRHSKSNAPRGLHVHRLGLRSHTGKNIKKFMRQPCKEDQTYTAVLTNFRSYRKA